MSTPEEPTFDPNLAALPVTQAEDFHAIQAGAVAQLAAEEAAQAPDREKLLQYARALGSIPIPQVKSAKAKKIVQALVTDILEAANSLREAAEKL